MVQSIAIKRQRLGDDPSVLVSFGVGAGCLVEQLAHPSCVDAGGLGAQATGGWSTAWCNNGWAT